MKFFKKLVVSVVIICVLFASVFADIYSIKDNKKYVIRNVYEIKNDSDMLVHDISARILVGADTDSLYQNLIDIQVNPQVTDMEKDDWGNVYGKVDIKTLNPGDSINIVIDKIVLNSGISFDKSIYSRNTDYSEYFNNPSNHKYVLPGEKIESSSEDIKRKAFEIAGSGTVMEKAKRIYDFVNLHIIYDTRPKYANKGALSGLSTGRGVCDEYSYLFTALCRAVGIPSRVVAGYWTEGHIEENKWLNISEDRHSWSELFMQGVGWVPAEPTFSFIDGGRRTPNYEYFANINSDDRHFINNYITKDLKKDLDVEYKHYSVGNVNLILESKEESIMMLPENYETAPRFIMDISNNWAKKYIEVLYADGIVFLGEDRLYKPDDSITRAEFASFIVNALGLEPVEGLSDYNDVDINNPLNGHINTATKMGLIQGYNNSFSPSEKITRQDVSVIVRRAIDFMDIRQGEYFLPDFEDKDSISDYAKESVNSIYGFRIMTGKPGNIFAPKDFTSRAEAAKIIWELRKYKF
ncbi:MAG: hypothetical protein GX154_11400 [Clostridiales bacterium]|nr:hypothetical protein [Clostridiales bacterium]